MWKDMLLQAFVSITPVFCYQAWVNKFGLRKASLFFGMSFGISMLLCANLSFELYEGFYADFRFLPYLIGSLYGGLPALFVLSGLYTILRIPQLNDWGDWIGFSAFLLIVIPLLILSIRPFRMARRKGKRKITYAIFCFGLLSALIFIQYAYGLQIHMPFIYNMLGALALIFVMTILSLHALENVQENYHTQIHLKRMSKNYRNEVYKLQQFIDETSIGVVIVDSEGRITHLNEMGLWLAVHSSEKRSKLEYLGKPFQFLFGDEDAYKSNARLEKALTGSNTTSELLEIRNKRLLQHVFSIRDAASGSIQGAAILIQDFTELLRLRDEVCQMERLSLVGQMAASITHEIRNPMAVIRGFVQLMKERSPEAQQEYFLIVMDELDRANAIISDFLSLAQNRIIDKESGSLHDILKELLPLLWADANLRGQSIELDLADNIPLIELNGREIKQMILNLARNGMEAMGEKGTLYLRTVKRDNGLELWVEDEGSGIPKEKMDRLFEPFFTTKARGTGLGLSVCLSIVERHNGRIEVKSMEGQGTKFVVTFMTSQLSGLQEYSA